MYSSLATFFILPVSFHIVILISLGRQEGRQLSFSPASMIEGGRGFFFLSSIKRFIPHNTSAAHAGKFSVILNYHLFILSICVLAAVLFTSLVLSYLLMSHFVFFSRARLGRVVAFAFRVPTG